ncbi:MAG: enoyl-CoA hydratase [Rhizorhabdus sp.]|nr:enoyl-CoA hydratase [Rhizorhabdus sp.]
MFQIDSVGRIARISIARPEARNAIPIARWQDLASAIAEVGRSDARALILRSAVTGIFCAGADISDLAALRDDPAFRRHFRMVMGQAIEALAALPIATIAAIDGGCFGAGVALAIACDLRVAGEGARFGITPAKLGISYPATDVARLKLLIGPGQAARLLYSAATIDAAEAKTIGLVEQHAAHAEQAAQALAETIAGNAPSSIRSLKRTLAGDPAADDLFEDAFGGCDFAEGLAAFGERRSPEFVV